MAFQNPITERKSYKVFETLLASILPSFLSLSSAITRLNTTVFVGRAGRRNGGAGGCPYNLYIYFPSRGRLYGEGTF